MTSLFVSLFTVTTHCAEHFPQPRRLGLTKRSFHNDPNRSSILQKCFTTLECFAAAEQRDKQALRRTALTNALIDGACVAALVPWTCPQCGKLSAGDVASETGNTVVALCASSRHLRHLGQWQKRALHGNRRGVPCSAKGASHLSVVGRSALT